MLRAIVIIVFAWSLVGCAQEQLPYAVVSPPSLNAGDTIPLPSETPILTVDGEIRSGELLLDRPTLRAMGVISYTVNDPFAGRPIAYEGVLLSKLLEVVGASPTARTLHMVALNDYEIDLQVSDVQRWPVMLAFMADGQVMTVAEKGPLMVVFPTHAFDIDPVAYESQWVWQLARIEVRN